MYSLIQQVEHVLKWMHNPEDRKVIRKLMAEYEKLINPPCPCERCNCVKCFIRGEESGPGTN